MANDLALSTGLVSGIDSGALVEALTIRQRETIKIQERKQHELTISKEEYQSIHSALSSLEEAAVNVSFESTFSRKTAKVGDEDLLGATANTSAEAANYQLSISQLATRHRVASDIQSSMTSPLLSEDATIQLNGVSLTVSAGANLNDLKTGINSLRSQTGVSAEIIDKRLILSSVDTGTENSMEIMDADGELLQSIGILNDPSSSGFGEANAKGQALRSVTIDDWRFAPGTFNINGAEFTLGGGETFNDLADMINNSGVEGLTAEGVGTRILIYSDGQPLNLQDVEGNTTRILQDVHYEESDSLGALNLNGKSLFINGQQIDFTTETTAEEVMDRINAKGISGVKATVAPDSSRLRIYSEPNINLNISGTAAADFGAFTSRIPSDPSFQWDYFNDVDETININGEDVVIPAYSSMTQIYSAINAVSGDSGVTASIVDGTELNFNSSDTIVIGDVSGSFAERTGLLSSSFKNELKTPQDAIFTINGVQATRSSNIITDVVENLTLELKSTGSSTLNIQNDSDTARTAIENFIERYNAAIELIDEKVRAKKDYNLKYLAEEERENLDAEALAEKEDELRKQVLAGDPLLQRAYNTLRQFSYMRVEGPDGINSLSKMGISTGAIGSNPAETRIGKLQIADESKFKAALENNLDQVKTFFTRTDENNPKGQGIGERLKVEIRRFTSFSGLLTQKAGRPGQAVSNSLIDKEIAGLTLDILNKNRSLLKYQESLLLTFQNMESSLQTLQNQSNAIAQAGSTGGF